MMGLCVRLFVSVQNGRPYMRTGLQGKPCLEQDLAGWAMDLLRYYVGQVSWRQHVEIYDAGRDGPGFPAQWVVIKGRPVADIGK